MTREGVMLSYGDEGYVYPGEYQRPIATQAPAGKVWILRKNQMWEVEARELEQHTDIIEVSDG